MSNEKSLLFAHLFNQLFHLNANLPIITNFSSIPENTFGVFVTIHRSLEQTLPSWPEDIHGCIGYWDPQYAAMSRLSLFEKMLDVGHSAMWSDSRRNYFAAIETDPYSRISIQWMLLPITPIAANSSSLYNSVTDGLIVQSHNGSRATYLPNVFPGKSWEEIKESLIQKAGISGGTTEFYSYKTREMSMTLFNCMKLREFIRGIMEPFMKTIRMTKTAANNTNNMLPITNANAMNINKKNNVNQNKNQQLIPYEVSNNQLRYSANEDVRNAGTLETCIRVLFFLSPDVPVPKWIFKVIRQYMRQYALRTVPSMRQSSAFILNSLTLLYQKFANNAKIRTSIVAIIGRIINDIVATIRAGNALEPQFERGEILLALNASLSASSVGEDVVEFMGGLNRALINDVVSAGYNKRNSDDSIFEANWNIQALNSIVESVKNKNINKINKINKK